MEFALFYEIPVARPWSRTSELEAYRNTLEQVIYAEEMGWHAVWSVEHHFLEEYSHCSNPEVLYGAIAARTERMRIGYGVRLMPSPYNHPVRSAESAAVLDLLSNGRVEFGTGRSTTRAELEGFGVDPHETRGMWREAVEHIVGCWTNDEYEFEGTHWSMPKRRVLPKPIQDPHPPVWGATGSEDGHRMMGQLGLGLLSFSVGTPPEELARRVAIYREGLASCTKPIGATINPRAACFTMVNCAHKREDRRRAPVVRVVPGAIGRAGRQPAEVARRAGGQARGSRHLRVSRRCRGADRAHGPRAARAPDVDEGLRGRRPRRRARHDRGLRRDRCRPAALPGEPVQRLARGRDDHHRAHGQARHPGVRELTAAVLWISGP
jgi:alkanesulfonate monooxygenase SsuD/methylene tetrahydromethanopterin reductase-like flavin-dependent oxidoreductase (luciferase family)